MVSAVEAGPEEVRLTGAGLTIEQVVAVARSGARVAELDAGTTARLEASRSWVDEAVRGGEVIYGVNTGFGSLANRRIRASEARQLSRNVILKCVTGVGDPLPADWVRAMLVVRANSLAKGYSGVRPAVVENLVAMLNRGVTPWVPSKGSLGASGDLAPLAHIATVLTRGVEETEDRYSGRAWYEGELLSGEEAMRRAGIPRLVPEAKEGLALTNGTAQMVAAGALGVHDAEDLLWHAELAAALSMEALLALSDSLDAAVHEVNHQPGQCRVAEELHSLLHGSRLIDSDAEKMQDAYSLRCTPQVLGPVADVLTFLRQRFEGALNAAADNPLIFLDGGEGEEGEHEGREGARGRGPRAVSGGNFHGEGPAMWLDFLGVAVAEIASLAERRIFRLLTPELNGGLPAMLAPSEGLNSGLMAAQYTAAALVSENKTLAHPDCVDSIPTSAGQEDHVSMGANAARHAWEILANVRTVVAIELLTAAQAIWLRPRGPECLGRGTGAAYRAIRERVEPVERDRELSPEIQAVEELMWSGALRNAVEGRRA